MANIPTDVSTQSTQTGSTGPQSNAADFGGQVGEGLEQLGRGLETGARYGSRAAKIAGAQAEFAKKLDDNRWASNAYEQEKMHMSEFMADPANNTKENFAGLLHDYTQNRIQQYAGADVAPSAEAMEKFTENFNRYAGDKYSQALDLSYSNKVNNSVTDTGQQITDMMNTYRNAAQVPGADGINELTDSIAHIGTNIESNFRSVAPHIADGLQKNLVTNAVLGTMTDNPEMARTILDGNDHIDERTRKTLGDEIDTAVNTRDLVERDSFNNTRQNLFTQGENGKNLVKIPLSSYSNLYPDDRAQAMKQQDDSYIDTLNTGNGILKDMAPMNVDSQIKKLSDLKSGINTKQDQDVYNMVAHQASQNIKMQEDNPAGWLQRNNPQVSSLATKAASAVAADQPAALKSLNEAVLKYQGPPPVGSTTEERAQYLNKPLNDRHLMPTDVATQTASELNNSTPKEFIAKMGQVMQRYPDDQQQYIAFNDLVTGPGRGQGLKQEYQLAWQNKDQWWLDTYLGAVQNSSNIKIPETASKDLTKRIDADPTWLQFQSAMTGDNFQRAGQISGFRSGIQTYAESLVAQGMSPADASKRSSSMLISSTLGISRVNGRPLMVVRDQGPGLPQRTDADVKNIGDQLQSSLKYIDPREIDQKSFPMLQALGKDPDRVGLQTLRDSVTNRGFFQTGNDGQSASLYYIDDTGSPFQVRDKSGNAFVIHFKDLPPASPRGLSDIGTSFYGEHIGEQTSKDDYQMYQVMQGKVTNWPTTDSFIKHEGAR